MNTSTKDIQIVQEITRPVNPGAIQNNMISTHSGRDYNQLATYDTAGTPSTGDMPQAAVVRQIEYNYEDENGDLAYQVIRQELEDGGKTFKQRQPEGHSWRWSIAGVSLVPYHLPRVLQVLRSGGLIFIVEGEKCADILNIQLKAQRLNAVATCNNGGAGHWGAVQSKWLSRAKVALLPDNDEPGVQHVVKASRHLLPHVKSLKRLELPDLPEKGDIADWLSAGHSIAELQALYHAASEYTPPPEPDAPKRERPVLRIVKGNSSEQRRIAAWAHAALEGEINELSKIGTGRWTALKSTAVRLGTIAAHSSATAAGCTLLTENECIDGTMYALQANGYIDKPGVGRDRAEKRVRLYFSRGYSGEPCNLPDPRDLPAELEKPTMQAPEDFVAYIPQKIRAWTICVPQAARGILAQYQGDANLLELIIEGKNIGRIKNDQRITVKCLVQISQELKRDMTEGVIRAMIRKATNPHGVQFLRKITQNTSNGEDYSSDRLKDSSVDFERNPCDCEPGRDEEYYGLLDIDTILSNLARYMNAPVIQSIFPVENNLLAPLRIEFLAALDIPNPDAVFDELTERYSEYIEQQPGYREMMDRVHAEHRQIVYRLRNPFCAPIPPDMPYPNAAAFKVASAYALLHASGGRAQYTRGLASAYIGVDKDRLKPIYDKAGIVVLKNRYGKQEIKTLGEFKAIKFGYDKHAKGFPKYVTSSRQEYRVTFGSRGVRDFVKAELEAGAAITVLFHQANMQVIKRLTMMGRALMGLLLRALEYLARPTETDQPELLPEKAEEAKDKPKKVVKLKERKEQWEVAYFKKLAVEWTAKASPTVQLALDALLNHEIVMEPDEQKQVFRPITVKNFKDVSDQWNRETRKFDDLRFKYVGRQNPKYGLPQSLWANPYKIGEDGTRDQVIAKYRAGLLADPDRLRSLRSLRGLTLVCWCDPEPCHGHVLAELAELPDDQLDTLIAVAEADMDAQVLDLPFIDGDPLLDPNWLMSIGVTVTEVIYHEPERIAA